MSESPSQRFEFGDLVLDLGRRQLFRGEEPIRLTKLNFELLRVLVTAAPNLLSRESLATAVWGPNRVVTPENLSQRVMALRRQLGDAASEPRYVEGIRGEGYRLIPSVKATSDGTALHSGSIRSTSGALPSRLPRSVAVLPLDNLSPNPSHAYFATGVHAEIIDHLARLKNVNTIARTSMQVYAGSSRPVSEIAAELGVETVLEGSVRYQGDRVRVSVNLIEPDFGTSLWSESYERALLDVFEIQTDIAVNVAEALQAELIGSERNAPTRRRAVSTEAYTLYMQALGLFVMHDTGNRIAAILDRALELDPAFAEAYGLAAYWRAMSYIDTTNRDAIDATSRDRLEIAVRDYAQRALELDANLAIAQAAVAMIDLVTWRWSAARKGFDRAHELGWTLDISPWLYSWLGRHKTAIARARRVVELNPHEWVPHRHLGVTLAYAGDYSGALDTLRNAAAMAPAESLTLAWILYVQIARGNQAEAKESLAALEQSMGVAKPFVFLPELAYACRRLGLRKQAQRLFEEIHSAASDQEVGPGAWAMAYLAVGDDESSLAHLEAAADMINDHRPDPSAINLLNLKMNFLADSTLDQPRFRNVLEAIRGD